jgi:hypothetical protein
VPQFNPEYFLARWNADFESLTEGRAAADEDWLARYLTLQLKTWSQLLLAFGLAPPSVNPTAGFLSLARLSCSLSDDAKGYVSAVFHSLLSPCLWELLQEEKAKYFPPRRLSWMSQRVGLAA